MQHRPTEVCLADYPPGATGGSMKSIWSCIPIRLRTTTGGNHPVSESLWCIRTDATCPCFLVGTRYDALNAAGSEERTCICGYYPRRPPGIRPKSVRDRVWLRSVQVPPWYPRHGRTFAVLGRGVGAVDGCLAGSGSMHTPIVMDTSIVDGRSGRRPNFERTSNTTSRQIRAKRWRCCDARAIQRSWAATPRSIW